MEAFRPLLAHKLPELQCADAFRVGNYHRALLYEVLKSGDELMTLAILQTIERMAWVDALPHIRGLARGNGIAKRNSAVHEAAQSCEHALHLVVNQLEAPQLLLRASTPAHSPSEVLRMADSTYSNPEADAQLLRPTLGQEETSARQRTERILSTLLMDAVGQCAGVSQRNREHSDADDRRS